jgi:hypothetical protein
MRGRRQRDEIDVLVPFDAIERFIARTHPDPDDVRHLSATLRGAIVAAPWVATVLGVSERKLDRWRARGIGYYEADQCATALGVHPSRIFDDWWRLDRDDTDPDLCVADRRRAEALAESWQLREVVTAA